MTLDAAAIRNGMAEVYAGECQLQVFAELDSTNKYLTRQLISEPTLSLPRLCVAEHQTAGVGRRGRVWHSPINSITFSLAQRFAKPSSELMGLSLVTGVAVAELIKKWVDPQWRPDIGVKWPNDLLVGQRKLGGILIEVPQTSSVNSTVVTGIGINVSQGDALSQVDQPYAVLDSLVAEVSDRGYLIGQIAGTVLDAYKQFEHAGWSVFADRWAAVDCLKGRAVTLTLATHGNGKSKPTTGMAAGVAEDGGLVIEHADQRKTYYSGEISVRADLD